ncbi:formylglycine-generating enzyme family protein [Kallotenue papyrolyticum]|uniref:formylglycine-generating enzyme family protein n=1 Tax=Kallotenue papyrolyticum TaxID=1325125 RepID=UPI00047852FE|nr:formylglycine-generating enzyme family protein [Kallotenue papyrolyticum]
MKLLQELEHCLPPLIVIPAGPFRMGTPDAQRSALAQRYGGTRESYADESPQHEVWVERFLIAQTPVTNALYALFQHDSGDVAPRAAPPTHPVVDVSWHEAQRFCAWLRQLTGQPFRLPTEAEWEKAARGTDGRAFPWGDRFDPARCNTRESGIGTTTPVDHYPTGASPYGVLDLAGNVYEWTQSLQAPYPYRAEDGRNGMEPLHTTASRRLLQRLLHRAPEHAPPPLEQRRIIRGGCYVNPEGFARCACRLRLDPAQRTPFVGFRLACDA